MRVGLVKRDALFKKLEVFWGNVTESSRRRIGIEGGIAADVHPMLKISVTVPCMEHHLVMIAKNRDEMTTIGQGNQLVENSLRVQSTVNVIAQSDNGVVWLRVDCRDESGQGDRATVNISDGDYSGHRALSKRNSSLDQFVERSSLQFY